MGEGEREREVGEREREREGERERMREVHWTSLREHFFILANVPVNWQ